MMGVIKFVGYFLSLMLFLIFYFYGGNVIFSYLSYLQNLILIGIICITLYFIYRGIKESEVNILKTIKNNFGFDKGTLQRKANLGVRKFFKYKAVWFALLVLTIFTIMAFRPSWITSYPQGSLYDALERAKPDYSTSPSFKHIMGLLPDGSDLFTVIAYSARNVFTIPFRAALYSVVLGLLIGSTAGYFRGFVDRVLMMLVESILAFSPLILFMVILTIAQTQDIRIWMYSAIGGATLSKIIRGQLFALRERDFVDMAKAAGCSEFEIIFRHLFPNCTPMIIVQTTNFIGQVLMYDATLAFIGLGGMGWAGLIGGFFNRYKINVFRVTPWGVIFPGICIMLAILSVNIIGEALRGALEVKENV